MLTFFCRICFLTDCLTEPEKQFALVTRHINKLKQIEELHFSEVVIMVERNL